jgi:7-cyano-7-deazaguanine synthase
MPHKVMVVLSGGQDSTTCLYLAKRLGNQLHAVTFDYNQRHRREIDAAVKIAEMAGVVSHEVVKLGPILKGTSPLVTNAPLEQYADHNSLPGGVEKTFVPMRNQLFLTLAANRAYVLGIYTLITGVSEEDYGGYPDCRRPFIRALTEACNKGTFCNPEFPGLLRINTPLIHMSKKDEVLMSLDLPGCYGALAWSHTGYDGVYPPTGKDHATLLRARGFEEAKVPDPLILRAVEEGQ